jgi:hypothetical protein
MPLPKRSDVGREIWVMAILAFALALLGAIAAG